MNPARCSVCGTYATQETRPRRGEWLTFADHQPADTSMLSHPQGLAYFCAEHLPGALELRHMTAEEAIAQLREHTHTEAVTFSGTTAQPATGLRRLISWLTK